MNHKAINRLKDEVSPYLLQHADNPVDWYPWCKEAFEDAKQKDRPVFLSIGYSTCHWCHVMAHESFEDRETAEILNKHFISIKVDREERPDIDSVYMAVCQAFTGSGGWPMSIFMTWDKRPFMAGTYFPARSKYGMPGFSDLLNEIIKRWHSSREELLQSADQVIAHLKKPEFTRKNVNNDVFLHRAAQMFSDSFDAVNGGFGAAPKFPVPHNLFFLMLYAVRRDASDMLEMVEKTLTQMRKGGIFDQIGYGFSRYSTDQYFLAPHFEKMLYDNALLTIAYTAAYTLARKRIYLDTAEKTAQYVLREMTALDGAFYSAQDADSEGIEGKYYTFTLTEIMKVLGKEKGEKFAAAFDITACGNFEGANIPNLLKNGDPDTDFGDEIQKLYDYRKNRSKLHLDDKILISWNSMMIAALSVLYRVSHDKKHLQAAVRAQIFLEKNLSDGSRLSTSWCGKRRSEKSFLDDYAFYIASLIELYLSTLDKDYLEKAEQFCKEAVKRFADEKNGGFYLSDPDGAELFLNPKETYDGAVPSGNSMMAYDLVRLYQLTKNEKYNELAGKQISFMSARVQDYPAGHSMFLFAKLIYDDPPEHIVIAVKEDSDLENVRKNLPVFANVVVASNSREYPLLNNRTTYYVCKNHTCQKPTNSI